MLVFTRLKNELIDVIHPDGTRIEICVIEIRGGSKVRIGVNAPKEVAIHRREVTEAIDLAGGEYLGKKHIRNSLQASLQKRKDDRDADTSTGGSDE
jgi:carbon storage regulator